MIISYLLFLLNNIYRQLSEDIVAGVYS